jgi:hypothetical protein
VTAIGRRVCILVRPPWAGSGQHARATGTHLGEATAATYPGIAA